MPVQTKEFFEETATEVASDMAMMPVQTSMPVISQVTAHVTGALYQYVLSHCTEDFMLQVSMFGETDMPMMFQLSSTMMSQIQVEVSVTVI